MSNGNQENEDNDNAEIEGNKRSNSESQMVEEDGADKLSEDGKLHAADARDEASVLKKPVLRHKSN